MKNNVQPHLKITPQDISPFVLLPGDPGRVEAIGRFLKNFQIISQNREFKIGVGTYKGRLITVCSTGIGCPSTAIAVEELINAGARVLIRVGTCGGAWRSDIPAGTMIIPTACVRDEGTTREYIPLEFPAVADFEICNALIIAAKNQNVLYRNGINRTHDNFYGSQESIQRWGVYLQDTRWRNADTPILSSDMETAALLVVASLRGVKAGCILAVNSEPEPLRDRLQGLRQEVTTETSLAISCDTINQTIPIALEALHSI